MLRLRPTPPRLAPNRCELLTCLAAARPALGASPAPPKPPPPPGKGGEFKRHAACQAQQVIRNQTAKTQLLSTHTLGCSFRPWSSVASASASQERGRRRGDGSQGPPPEVPWNFRAEVEVVRSAPAASAPKRLRFAQMVRPGHYGSNTVKKHSVFIALRFDYVLNHGDEPRAAYHAHKM